MRFVTIRGESKAGTGGREPGPDRNPSGPLPVAAEAATTAGPQAETTRNSNRRLVTDRTPRRRRHAVGDQTACPGERLPGLRVGLVDPEGVPLEVEVVPLPGHPGERHLRQRHLPTGLEDAAFGLVVVTDTDGAHERVRPLAGRGGRCGALEQAAVDPQLVLGTGHDPP